MVDSGRQATTRSGRRATRLLSDKRAPQRIPRILAALIKAEAVSVTVALDWIRGKTPPDYRKQMTPVA
jgi:hypothetical protein